MTTILRDCVTAVVVVVHTRPRAMITMLALITTRKSICGFPLLTYTGLGILLGALRAAGAPLKTISKCLLSMNLTNSLPKIKSLQLDLKLERISACRRLVGKLTFLALALRRNEWIRSDAFNLAPKIGLLRSATRSSTAVAR